MTTEMNLIKKHADDYFNRVINDVSDSERFISYVRRNAIRYVKSADKIVFFERMALQIKIRYDRHLLHCSLYDMCSCRFATFYEGVLFVLQEELNKLENSLLPTDFKSFERENINISLKKIVNKINDLELGNVLDYGVFVKEIEELKDYYYLNKKIWNQLLIGKLTEMLGRKMVSVALCKEIITLVNDVCPSILIKELE